MGRSIAVRVVLALSFSSALSGSAWSLESNDRPKLPPSAKKIENLSNDECTKAGGMVGPATVCNSKSSCVFFDENKVRHEVCISVKKN